MAANVEALLSVLEIEKQKIENMQKSLFENEKMSDALQPALQQCTVSCCYGY